MKRALHNLLKVNNWVRVHWDDIVAEDEGWIESHKAKTSISACITVGVVVKKDKKQVILSPTQGRDDKIVGTTWAIPLGCINDIELLPPLPPVPVLEKKQ